MILVYLPIITIARRKHYDFRHFEKTQGKPKDEMEKIPGSKRRRPKDAGRLLVQDKALDDKCQGRKYRKCERVGEKFYYL